MKKLLASLLAGAMALSLVACGGGSSSAPGSASGAEPAQLWRQHLSGRQLW